MIRRSYLGLLLVPLLAACATTGQTATNNETETQKATQQQGVVVQVVNQNFNDVDVYAISGTRTTRLGTVFGNSTETFPVERWRVDGTGDLRLLADPIGSSYAYLSDQVIASPGDTVQLQVSADLGMSTVTVD